MSPDHSLFISHNAHKDYKQKYTQQKCNNYDTLLLYVTYNVLLCSNNGHSVRLSRLQNGLVLLST